MKKFRVEVWREDGYILEVEAKNAAQAEELACELVENGEAEEHNHKHGDTQILSTEQIK